MDKLNRLVEELRGGGEVLNESGKMGSLAKQTIGSVKRIEKNLKHAEKALKMIDASDKGGQFTGGAPRGHVENLSEFSKKIREMDSYLGTAVTMLVGLIHRT
jgi:hypothetical protein